jgi:type IV secretory pathway VirB4 component
MVPISKQLKPFRKCGAIEQWVAPTRFLNEHAFHCKTGWIGLLMKTPGINYEALTQDMLTAVSKRIQSALRSVGPEFALYQYIEKRRVRAFPSEERYEDPRLEAAVQSRLEFLKKRNLFNASIHWCLTYEVQSSIQKLPLLSSFRSPAGAIREMADRATRDAGYLESKARSFAEEIRDLLGLELVNKQEVFLFLRRIVNLDEELAESLPLLSDEAINYFIADRELAGHNEQVVVSDDFEMRVLSLRQEPKQIGPNFFEELYAIECQWILCTRYQKMSAQKAKEEVSNASSTTRESPSGSAVRPLCSGCSSIKAKRKRTKRIAALPTTKRNSILYPRH